MTFGNLFIKMNPSVKVVENGTCIWLYFDSVNYYTFAKEWWDKEIPNNNEWISVKDRLPEEYGNYLAVVDDEVTECTYSGPFIKGMIKGWSTCNANGLKWLRDEHVTCWMPLPEPPKEET